jgi:predicted TIM-barrel fold metal-dependent hydrolase
VLQSHPNLQLNLAHFGGFEEVGRPPRNENTWEWTIGRMWAKSPNAYVYADMSFFSEILGDAEKREDVKARLKTFKSTFQGSEDRLIYGSDWTMIGREPGVAPVDLEAHRPYPELVANFLFDSGFSDAAIEKIMYRNSIRFLGLERGGGTRGRIEAFCRKAGLDVTWLSAFDA